jgi:hypothetical protein
MNPQARGNSTPGLFCRRTPFFCLAMPQKTSLKAMRFPVGAFGWFWFRPTLSTNHLHHAADNSCR